MYLKALATAALLACGITASADTFTYSLQGGSGLFNGSGTLTAVTSGVPGTFLITAITGTGVTGLISPGGYSGNDNLLFPLSSVFVDAAGFAFTEVSGPDTFRVNLHSSGTSYFATLTDEDNFTSTVPVTFASSATVTPEPSTIALLGSGLLGVAVRKRRST